MVTIMSFANKDNFTSFPVFMAFISFSRPIAEYKIEKNQWEYICLPCSWYCRSLNIISSNTSQGLCHRPQHLPDIISTKAKHHGQWSLCPLMQTLWFRVSPHPGIKANWLLIRAGHGSAQIQSHVMGPWEERHGYRAASATSKTLWPESVLLHICMGVASGKECLICTWFLMISFESVSLVLGKIVPAYFDSSSCVNILCNKGGQSQFVG